MNEEQHLIQTFYSSFNNRDLPGMLSCYKEDIIFYDPVFENRRGAEVRGMWSMLISSAKDFTMTVKDIEAEDGYGSCFWTASYTFPKTGRKVVNKGKAFFKFSEGRISEHQDDYDLWSWSRQALGLPGLLFGWSPVIQKQIRSRAGKSLAKYMGAGNFASAAPDTAI